MPAPGLSLVGFLDQDAAVQELRYTCVQPDGCSDDELIQYWQTAKQKLGDPIVNAGQPNIQDLSTEQQQYLSELGKQQWVQAAFEEIGGPVDVKLIELDPLLAFQFHLYVGRADHHCSTLTRPPTPKELMECSLPMQQPQEPYHQSNVTPQSSSVIVTTPNNNLRSMKWGIHDVNFGGLKTQIAGLVFYVSLPFLHVVRLNGRYYLHNGYHRAYGLRKAGATHAPCVLRDVDSPEAVGIRPRTFDLALLETSDPPTLCHYTQDRAINVQLRQTSRVLHVSWHEYTVPTE